MVMFNYSCFKFQNERRREKNLLLNHTKRKSFPKAFRLGSQSHILPCTIRFQHCIKTPYMNLKMNANIFLSRQDFNWTLLVSAASISTWCARLWFHLPTCKPGLVKSSQNQSLGLLDIFPHHRIQSSKNEPRRERDRRKKLYTHLLGTFQLTAADFIQLFTLLRFRIKDGLNSILSCRKKGSKRWHCVFLAHSSSILQFQIC